MAMTAGQEPPPGEEQTFADVLHGLTFGGRRDRRDRHTRRAQGRKWEHLRPATEPAPPQSPSVPGVPSLPATPPPSADDALWPTEEPPPTAAIVRPYTWTKGRTSPSLDLELETLVSTERPLTEQDGAPVEHWAIAELCTSPRSVAEVSALLSVPLGVAKVLISDMAETGLLTVHRTAATAGSNAHFMLMERVLSGLRRL
jgi:Protein of unknown function (DUF742)